MIEHMLNPVIVSIGSLQIRWYSLFYIIGLAIAYFIIHHIARERNLRLTKDDVLDFIVYIAAGLLVGARVFYFIFYDFSGLIHDPLELFRVWHGGMSFHGGLIGVLVSGYIFCRKKGVDFWDMADITVIPLGLGLALGRIGNFINGELYGRVWNGALCIDYSHNPYLDYLPKMCRYPSQLVESLKNILIFTVLWNIRNRKLPKGFLFWTFVTMYGFLRFFIEFIRQPDPQLGFVIGPFTMGQVLCSVMILVGGTMLVRLTVKSRKRKTLNKKRKSRK